MNRLFPYTRSALFFAGLTLLCTAHATDIDCDPAAPQADRPQAHRLICESALFSMGHQRIVANQRRLLQSGAITEADIATFRNRRDACHSASCLDAVFRQWRAFATEARRKP